MGVCLRELERGFWWVREGVLGVVLGSWIWSVRGGFRNLDRGVGGFGRVVREMILGVKYALQNVYVVLLI